MQGGGQALGLEMAGFHHVAAVEYEPHYCTTLRKNRPQWNAFQRDIWNFSRIRLRELSESVRYQIELRLANLSDRLLYPGNSEVLAIAVDGLDVRC